MITITFGPVTDRNLMIVLGTRAESGDRVAAQAVASAIRRGGSASRPVHRFALEPEQARHVASVMLAARGVVEENCGRQAGRSWSTAARRLARSADVDARADRST